MSTSRLPKPGQRPADYANIGYAGRKTGVVLKDTGDRDEYGMPNIDDLFSPPPQSEASSKKFSLVNGTSRATAGEEPSHAPEFQRDATTYSSPRKSLPPRARSPIKTSIGSPRKSVNGSPTKTMGLLASPVRMKAPVQTYSDDQEGIDKSTFLSNKHKRRSLEQAPKRPPVVNQPKQHQTLRKSLFDVPSSPAVLKKGNGTTTTLSPGKVMQDTRSLQVSGAESNLPSATNGQLHVNGRHSSRDNESRSSTSQTSSSPAISNRGAFLPIDLPPKSKRKAEEKNKRRFSDIEAAERAQQTQPVIQVDPEEYDFQPDIGGFDDDDVDFGPEHEVLVKADHDTDAPGQNSPKDSPEPLLKSFPAVSASLSKPVPVKSSDQTLKRRSPLYDDIQEETPSPAKRQRQSVQQPMLPPPKPISRNTKEPEKPKIPPNLVKSRREKHEVILPPAAEARPPTSPYRSSRPKGRGLQIVKNQIESEADGARYTRSGRTSVKPVEYWRGERVIYTAPKREGNRVSLPGIQDVIRIEDGPSLAKPTAKRKPGKRHQKEQSIEPQYEPEQEWEIEPGVFMGEVPSWDSEKQRSDIEYPEQIDLALAPAGWEALTKEVQGASFQFAKILTLPFFHAGMLDLPPGGEKMLRNARRNHMAFLVLRGRVVVDVSGNQFSLGREGFWQVPRGNTYGVKNPYQSPARIFFSQACYMTEAEGVAHEEAQVAEAAQD